LENLPGNNFQIIFLTIKEFIIFSGDESKRESRDQALGNCHQRKAGAIRLGHWRPAGTNLP
jgi:hypothetical protein